MPVRITRKLLSQRRPKSINATILYQPPTSITTSLVKTILVCNTTASNITFSLWLNDAAQSSGDDFAIYKDSSLIANETKIISLVDESLVMRGNASSLLCSSSVASAINFTVFGAEVEES